MKELFYVNSKITGGHFAFKTEKSKKPFENPMSECMALKLLPEDTVVDIGAYVGEYSLYASRFVKKVISYEATPETFDALSKNKKENIDIYNMAVTGIRCSSVKLFASKGIGVTNSIAKTTGKKESIVVQAIKYDDAIKNATVVKIDVEGAEYGYRILENLTHLRGIIIEFHPMVNFNWKQYAIKILNGIEEAGFIPLRRAKFNSGWSLISTFERI